MATKTDTLIRCGNHGRMKTYHETREDVKACFAATYALKVADLVIDSANAAVKVPTTMDPRSTVRNESHIDHVARKWSRTINGVDYSFHVVTMFTLGETRLIVHRYNGYGEVPGSPESRVIGKRFGCAWDLVHWITLPGIDPKLS